jgi:hypothetical protein
MLSGGEGSEGMKYLLPKGTTLYFDQAFPEGFVRYRVYVNVEGVDLPSSTLSDPTRIDPLSAYPIDRGELAHLLKNHPISKADLAAILRSGQLTKEDIRSLLEEYSR